MRTQHRSRRRGRVVGHCEACGVEIRARDRAWALEVDCGRHGPVVVCDACHAASGCGCDG